MKFEIGQRVRKTKGSQWKGVIVGTYSTELTPEGYAVESDTEHGSVQIYPAAALELFEADDEREAFEAWISQHHDGVKHARGLDRLWSDARYCSMEVEWAHRAWIARAQSAPVGVPFDLREFARLAAIEMEKHDFHGFEPVVLAVLEDMLAAAPSAPAATQAPSAQDVAGLVEALSDAAQSLETIDRLAGRDEYMQGMVETRAYARGRASVARSVLAARNKKSGV